MIMKRLLTTGALFLCSLLTYAQFTGWESDSQGVVYAANEDGETCYVSHCWSGYSSTIVVPEIFLGMKVTRISNQAFCECSSLTSITLPDGLTSIGGYAFADCSSLTSITIPEGVTRIEDGTFAGCSSLTSITIPESVTSIGENAFNGCSSLICASIGNSVTSIGEAAFYGCSALTYASIGKSVTTIGRSAFGRCNLSDIYCYAEEVPTGSDFFVFPTSAYGILLHVPKTSINLYKSALTWKAMNIIPIDETIEINGICFKFASDERIAEIAQNPKMYCNSIEIPKTVVYDGISYQVTSISKYAFRKCSGLTNITIPEGVISIGPRAFEDCSSLTSVAIPNSVTSISNEAFRYCTGLTTIIIPEGVISIGPWAFYNCSSLTSVAIPNSVTSIGSFAFLGCTSLTSIVVESNNPIYDSRSDCNAIIETATNTLIAGCETTVIPSNISSIGNYAFDHCTGLTSISLPDGLTKIGSYAFNGCI